MSKVQAVPSYKTRRNLMMGCGTYFPHVVPAVGGWEPPPKRDPEPKAEEEKPT